MPTALTDADKVIRNDTGKEIAAAIRDLAAPEADKVAYDNTSSGLSADNAQDAIDELASEKMEKVNPTGTGSLSLNRKSGTTTGSYSVAVGYNCEASSNQAYAEGNNTVASGTYSHAQGWGTIANHRGQTALGEYNTEDPSTAAAYSRGNYIEIVGKGTNDANRSNARTLDWNGNETLAGDLKINGNQSLSALWTVLSGLTVLSEKSGSIASFSTDIADKLFSCYVNVTAVQAGSGTPAPDNVRAISGWSGANISSRGKNVFNYNAWKSVGVQRGTAVFENNGITLTATSSDAYTYFDDSTFPMGARVPIREGQKITLSWEETSNNAGLIFIFGNGLSARQVVVNNSANKSVTYTAVSGDYFVTFRFGVANSGVTISYKNIQIEYSDVATTYEVPKGTTHNIPFNQTVYGGVLDVLSGVLTVTHGYVDLGTLSYTQNNHQVFGTYYYADIQSLGLKRQVDYTRAFNNICEEYAVVGRNASEFIDFTLTHDGTNSVVTQVQVKNSNCADATAMQTALNGVKLVYELATPTVIQLTPTEVKTILGQNNIFADCGDIDLKYLETIGNRLT